MLVPIANAWLRDGASSRIAGQCSFDGWPGRGRGRGQEPRRGTCSPSLSSDGAGTAATSGARGADDISTGSALCLASSNAIRNSRKRGVAPAEPNRSKRSHRRRANKEIRGLSRTNQTKGLAALLGQPLQRPALGESVAAGLCAVAPTWQRLRNLRCLCGGCFERMVPAAVLTTVAPSEVGVFFASLTAFWSSVCGQ